MSKVEDLADTQLAQKISQVTGVGLVSISGGQKPAVRVQANPTALASYGLGLEDIRTALAAANVDQAKGTLDGPRQSFTIGANDQLLASAQYKPIVIAYRNGAPVRLDAVANVTDSVENTDQSAWMGQGSVLSPAVIVNIQRQPGANIISVADKIKLLLPQLQASLPAAVRVSILTDRTETIRASVKDVEFELTLTIVLVVLVIFLVSAESARDDHSQRCRALVDCWNLRGDVPARVQLEQLDADGSHDFNRVSWSTMPS